MKLGSCGAVLHYIMLPVLPMETKCSVIECLHERSTFQTVFKYGVSLPIKYFWLRASMIRALADMTGPTWSIQLSCLVSILAELIS